MGAAPLGVFVNSIASLAPASRSLGAGGVSMWLVQLDSCHCVGLSIGARRQLPSPATWTRWIVGCCVLQLSFSNHSHTRMMRVSLEAPAAHGLVRQSSASMLLSMHHRTPHHITIGFVCQITCEHHMSAAFARHDLWLLHTCEYCLVHLEYHPALVPLD